MEFPIRCFTCNAPIEAKYLPYLEKVKEIRRSEGKGEKDEMEYLTAITTKTAEGKALDELRINKPCCRRHFLSYVELL